jgi:hypothetical protein
MSSPKTYLISCPCSADVPVSPGQAGDRVICPACGREVDVPKLREFGGLRRHATEASASQTPWSVAHAVLLSGVVLATLCGAGSFFILPQTEIVLNAEAIRAAVRAADDRDVYRAWKQSFSRQGVRRPPTDEEKQLQRFARFSGGVSQALWIVGALGAVAAAAAAVGIFSRRPAVEPRAAGPSKSPGGPS